MLMHTVETYLAVRRAAGYELIGLERYLRDFARYATEQGDEHIVAQTAINWAGQTHSPEQRHLRLQMLIQLARFSRAEDPRHELPPKGVYPRHYRRPTPYIFCPYEIQALIAQAACLGPPDSLRPHTYSTLIALLALTGLRISEAIALRFSDYVSEGLVIRESKFRNSRMVALHPTGHTALQRYIEKRLEFDRHDEDHIFISGRHRTLCAAVVRATFRKLLVDAGISRANGGSKPRLMDLRHTYATTVLLAGPDNRDHVCRHMVALSTAMGHNSIAATFWYLERTPALMNDIAQACQNHIGRRQS